jgi:inosine/xanthosine triphosphatase
MDVAVGSANPVKRRAVERALADRVATVAAVDVDSGVSEQPRSREETIRGADTRARRALSESDADLGVGIEGGVGTIEAVDGLFLLMWASVTDGQRLERSGGPSIRLPESIADRIRAGEELGPVLDDVLDTSGVAREQGAAGILTDGIVDRESSLVHAVAGAFGPFLIERY